MGACGCEMTACGSKNVVVEPILASEKLKMAIRASGNNVIFIFALPVLKRSGKDLEKDMGFKIRSGCN